MESFYLGSNAFLAAYATGGKERESSKKLIEASEAG
jgi:hypothetical protein